MFGNFVPDNVPADSTCIGPKVRKLPNELLNIKQGKDIVHVFLRFPPFLRLMSKDIEMFYNIPVACFRLVLCVLANISSLVSVNLCDRVANFFNFLFVLSFAFVLVIAEFKLTLTLSLRQRNCI